MLTTLETYERDFTANFPFLKIERVHIRSKVGFKCMIFYVNYKVMMHEISDIWRLVTATLDTTTVRAATRATTKKRYRDTGTGTWNWNRNRA